MRSLAKRLFFKNHPDFDSIIYQHCNPIKYLDDQGKGVEPQSNHILLGQE